MRILSIDVGYRRMGVCLMDVVDSHVDDILYWADASIVEPSTSATIATRDLVDQVACYIHSHDYTYTIPDVVVIEQQPPTSPKMVAISNALHAAIRSHALCVGHTELRVCFVSARTKFGRYIQTADAIDTYTRRKQIVKSYVCKWYSLWSTKQCDDYDAASLSYDMCDAFLNGCAYARVSLP